MFYAADTVASFFIPISLNSQPDLAPVFSLRASWPQSACLSARMPYPCLRTGVPWELWTGEKRFFKVQIGDIQFLKSPWSTRSLLFSHMSVITAWPPPQGRVPLCHPLSPSSPAVSSTRTKKALIFLAVSKKPVQVCLCGPDNSSPLPFRKGGGMMQQIQWRPILAWIYSVAQPHIYIYLTTLVWSCTK